MAQLVERPHNQHRIHDGQDWLEQSHSLPTSQSGQEVNMSLESEITEALYKGLIAEQKTIIEASIQVAKDAVDLSDRVDSALLDRQFEILTLTAQLARVTAERDRARDTAARYIEELMRHEQG